ncbi:MAG: hypothetical protein ACYDA6_07200 [Solirubrobacteraceae bacterium]
MSSREPSVLVAARPSEPRRLSAAAPPLAKWARGGGDGRAAGPTVAMAPAVGNPVTSTTSTASAHAGTLRADAALLVIVLVVMLCLRNIVALAPPCGGPHFGGASNGSHG